MILSRVYVLALLTREQRTTVVDRVERFFQRFFAKDATANASLDGSAARPQDLASAIGEMEDARLRDLARAAFVLSDPKWNAVEAGRVLASVRRLRELLASLPEGQQGLHVIEGDARQMPLSRGSVDLVVTSPPYINVFNYHQQYRPAVEALGHDVLEAARSEIGSNRKHRMNRFLTVVQYAIDMHAVAVELNRVTAPNGRIIFVLGRESRVRGIPIFNGDFFCEISTRSAGLIVLTRQERAFTNRFGQRIVEDILHFSRGSDTAITPQSTARQIGHQYLEHLLPMASGEIRADILAAIKASNDVLPSPVFSEHS